MFLVKDEWDFQQKAEKIIYYWMEQKCSKIPQKPVPPAAVTFLEDDEESSHEM